MGWPRRSPAEPSDCGRRRNGVGRRVLRTIAKVSSDNYPEVIEKMYLVDVPWIFRSVWAFMRPLIDKRTRERITILGVRAKPRIGTEALLLLRVQNSTRGRPALSPLRSAPLQAKKEYRDVLLRDTNGDGKLDASGIQTKQFMGLGLTYEFGKK